MKKLLVTTTALASMVASIAFAEMPTVSVGGRALFEAASVSQKSQYKKADNNGDYALSNNNKSLKFRNRNNVNVMVTGKADNGMKYGANLALTASDETNAYGDGKSRKSYMFLESQMGRVELGSNWSATKLMQVGAESIAKGTGGASDGCWSSYVVFPGGNDFYLRSGDLATVSNMGHKEEARKITYMTPRYSGFQVGASFTPDMSNLGNNTALDADNAMARVKDVISLGLNYTNTYDNFNLALSAGFEKGQRRAVDAAKYHDLKAYNVGLALGTGDFTLAGSYGKNGKSATAKTGKQYDSKYYTLGVAFENGPMGLSVTHFNSEEGGVFGANDYKKNKVRAYSLGADYKMAAGLNMFAEVTSFDLKPSKTVKEVVGSKNSGTVFVLGSKVTF